ncbi:MAG: amidohydrolase [Bacteroidales bacterium]|jgi:amidohydrolase|nr:amidohydrolase [Bacteroidales bacterium]
MRNNIIQIIKQESNNIVKEIILIRRHIHKYPELSFQEIATSNYIEKILQENGIETDRSLGYNSVIGIIRKNNENNFVALRADIDALPIEEETNCDFKSVNSGIMHACGHDAHAATLIGVGIILKKLVEYSKNNILLLFQPAEEKNPGGAKLLIDNGLLEKYNIKKIIAQHVDPEIETGSFSFGKGRLMASSDELYLTFSGIGGHAAMPQKRSDSVLAAINFINQANIFQKKINVKTPSIIAFGKVIANGAVNVIPEKTFVEGTIRTYDENVRNEIKIFLKKIAQNFALEYKCEVSFEISEGYPSLLNNDKLFDEIFSLSELFLNKKNIFPLQQRMTSEDFAWYSKKIPAILYRTGVSSNKTQNFGLHNPKFQIEESFFEGAVGLMSFLGISL